VEGKEEESHGRGGYFPPDGVSVMPKWGRGVIRAQPWIALVEKAVEREVKPGGAGSYGGKY